jgi:hypothetical protein
VDANFRDVDGRIVALEENPPVPAEITNFTNTGTTQATLYIANGDTFTIDLPQSSPSFSPVPTGQITGATFTLIIDTANRMIECVHASGCAVTFPPHADVPFPVGCEITFVAYPGPLTFIAGTGVTFNWLEGHDLATERDGATVAAKQMEINRWRLFGSLKVTA